MKEARPAPEVACESLDVAMFSSHPNLQPALDVDGSLRVAQRTFLNHGYLRDAL
jgi:hypothetical protein